LKTPADIWLNYCLLERPKNLEQETSRCLMVIEWQCVLPSSFQDSKQTDIELLEDVRRMRCQGYDSDLGIPQKTENLFAGVARAVIYQSDGIFVGKFLKTSQPIEIGQKHRADILKDNFSVDGSLCTRFQNEGCVETSTMFV
jgi:hypothetical protein